jgi:C1A family cysteine protease
MPPVYDQGQLGSCTAQAVGAAVAFDRYRQGLDTSWTPSRLFIYYNERAIEGTVNFDAGAMIRTGVKVVAGRGVCHEPSWPYNPQLFAVQPPHRCYVEALHCRAASYRRVGQTLSELRGCLADGNPIVFGFSVYESFESAEVARTGKARLPTRKDRLLGGHAVLAVGYDDAAGRFLCRNSWGAGWADKGYFTLPYSYLTERGLSADFWTITTVTAN